MSQLRKLLSRPLSSREVAAATLIALVLAWSGYAAYHLIAAKLLERRVRAAIPKVCASVREQRRTLISAIEAYKAHFGVYPQDHLLSAQPHVVDPVTNTLLYELAGVIYNPTNQLLFVGHLEPAEAKFVTNFFHCNGFRNSAQTEQQLKRLLPIEYLPVKQLHDDPDVFVLSFAITDEQIDWRVAWEIEISSWRYVSSAPTHNTGEFDLWIELQAKGHKVTIGNWKSAD